MRSSSRKRKHDATEDVGVQLLLSFGLLESLLPIGGSEFEQATARPGDQTEEVTQVGERLDVVEPSAGEQRDEDRVDESAVVAADEKPVSTPENLAPQVPFADVVT